MKYEYCYFDLELIGDVENLSNHNSRWRRLPSLILKNVCRPVLFDRPLQSLKETLEFRFETILILLPEFKMTDR